MVIVILFTLSFQLRHLLFGELALIEEVPVVVLMLTAEADDGIAAVDIEVIHSLNHVRFGLYHQSTVPMSIHMLFT